MKLANCYMVLLEKRKNKGWIHCTEEFYHTMKKKILTRGVHFGWILGWGAVGALFGLSWLMCSCGMDDVDCLWAAVYCVHRPADLIACFLVRPKAVTQKNTFGPKKWRPERYMYTGYFVIVSVFMFWYHGKKKNGLVDWNSARLQLGLT